MKTALAIAALLCLLITSSFAETWAPFSFLVNDSDFIAQYQELTRDGKVVGTRLVAVYWEKKDFVRPKDLNDWKPWTLADYKSETDVVKTKFVFLARGQHLWTAESTNGVIQYPGSTAEHGVGAEISCSPTEFHDILQQIGSLKREGRPMKGNLTLKVFGKESSTQ